MAERPQAPLERRLPPAGEVTPEALLEGFLEWVMELGLELYPAQEEAVLELFAGNNVILNTPTGSGKSLVALALCYKALAEDRSAFYTAPIKALVSEKFFDLCRVLGPDNVGMMTGDAAVNREAAVVCCTAEVLSNLALRMGPDLDCDYVVMDEFHYYADRDRGTAWQVPLLTLPQCRFLLMSATLGDTKVFEEELTKLTGEKTVLVKSDKRPVPLDFSYRETPLPETIKELLGEDRAPIYIVHFTQRAANEQAQDLMSFDFLPKEKKQAIKEAIGPFRFDTAFGRKELRRYVHHGVGVHHAGMLPKYRLLVEKLAQRGHLKLICGTDTLGVGVNIPIRTVLFTQLCKFDGEKTRILSVRDFKQIAGRAGRKGFDDRGSVVVQAPEHIIENKLLALKAGGDPKKMRKTVFKKPPEKGFASWDPAVFDRLMKSEPERLSSSFQVNHGMLLNVLSRGPREGCRAMKEILRSVHERPKSRRHHARTAIALFRSLVEAGIAELQPGGVVEIDEELGERFSLHQSLSLFVVETIERLDPIEPDYALDVLSLVEAVLEDPNIILMKQLDRIKDAAIAEMKAEGMEYEERMAALDKLDIPKPNAELIYGRFEEFRKHHPWVGTDHVRPKSVAREMFEEGRTFHDEVAEYGLERSEGVLLRYLSNAYKAMVQTVPERARTEEVDDLTDWLGTMVRTVDSSLLDEWERMVDPETVLAEPSPEPELPAGDDITRDERAFTVLVRNAVWRVVKHLARRENASAAALVEGEPPWTGERITETLAPYWEQHGEIRTDPVARNPKHTTIDRDETRWRVRQPIPDPGGDHDWHLDLDVDLEASREAERPVLRLTHLGD